MTNSFVAAIATRTKNKMVFPPLGNTDSEYSTTLSEAEINAIHAASGFINAARSEPNLKDFCNHYGPTLEELSKNLARETED